jgi:hypothetical protein
MEETKSSKLLTLASATQARLVVPIPRLLPYRRLYLGGLFTGTDAVDAVWSCRLRFQGPNSGILTSELRFGWKQKGTAFNPAEAGRNLDNDWLCAPPHSVEVIENGSAAQYLSSSPAQRDEMIGVSPSTAQADVSLVRMLPIPLFTRGGEVEILWAANCSSGGEYFFGVFGLRSSEVPL